MGEPTRRLLLLLLGFKAFEASDPPFPLALSYTFVYEYFYGDGYIAFLSLKGASDPQIAVKHCPRGCAWQIHYSDGTADILCVNLKTLWQEGLRQMKLGVHSSSGIEPRFFLALV